MNVDQTNKPAVGALAAGNTLPREEKVAPLSEMLDTWEVSPDALPSTPLSDEDLHTLDMNGWALGQKEPIILDAQGRILDGRKRLRICIEIGVEPIFVTASGTAEQALPDAEEETPTDVTGRFEPVLTLLREHGDTWGYGDTRGRLCNAFGGMAAANAMLAAARSAGVVSFPRPPFCDSPVALVGGLR